MGDRQPTPLIGRRERVPTHVEAAVLTALEKLPADRFASAAEFARALTSEGAYRRESASQSGAHVAARKLRNAVVALVVAFVIVSGLALWGWLRRADGTLIAGTTARATIPLPPDQLLGADARPFDIASDGTEVVYVADVAGRPSLFVRPLGTFDARALPGTDGGAGTARRAVRRQSHGDHGAPVPAFEAFRGPGRGSAQFAVSRAGTLIYVAGGFDRTMVLVDRNGRESAMAVPPRGYRFPRFAPAGDRVAVTVDPRPSRIWLVDIRHSTSVPITKDVHNIQPIWRPDGGAIVFRNRDGATELRLADGTQVVHRYRILQLQKGTVIGHPFATDWSTTRGILYQVVSGSDKWIATARDDSTLVPLPGSTGSDGEASLSPDQHWVALRSTVSGVPQVYVRPFPGAGELRLVSSNGGVEPRWSADGRELFYRESNRIMHVSIRTVPTFETLGPPQELFAGTFDFSQENNWDVGRDGRFLMIRGDARTRAGLLLVTNWFDELRAKAPH